jgi:hypothetical protein
VWKRTLSDDKGQTFQFNYRQLVHEIVEYMQYMGFTHAKIAMAGKKRSTSPVILNAVKNQFPDILLWRMILRCAHNDIPCWDHKLKRE